MLGSFFAFEYYRIYITNDRQLCTHYGDVTRQMFKDRMSAGQIIDYNNWREAYEGVAIPLLEQQPFSKREDKTSQKTARRWATSPISLPSMNEERAARIQSRTQ